MQYLTPRFYTNGYAAVLLYTFSPCLNFKIRFSRISSQNLLFCFPDHTVNNFFLRKLLFPRLFVRKQKYLLEVKWTFKCPTKQNLRQENRNLPWLHHWVSVSPEKMKKMTNQENYPSEESTSPQRALWKRQTIIAHCRDIRIRDKHGSREERRAH